MNWERAAFVEINEPERNAEMGCHQRDFGHGNDLPFGADDGTKADATDNCKSVARS